VVGEGDDEQLAPILDITGLDDPIAVGKANDLLAGCEALLNQLR
jgi:hypothetical protein